jgi:sulfonate dioxygenase
MAPSAVETVTVPVVSAAKRTTFGAYKELAPSKFDPEAEAGKKGFQGAKVKPTLLSGPCMIAC